MTVVAKFGGTSMADAATIRQVADILCDDGSRQVAVVSAPGRSAYYQVKVTDLLLQGEVDQVMIRFYDMMTALSLDTTPLSRMATWVKQSTPAAKVAFGEYMSAYILAKYLNWRFVDARRVVCIDGERLTVDTEVLGRYRSRGERLVIPGFYGASTQGEVTLLPRGGSDITGSLIAAALNARLYENWTDVDGVYTKDPRHHHDAELIRYLSYRDMYTHGLAGSAVFHADAVRHVAEYRVPIRIRNTFRPEVEGTLVS